MANKEVWKMNSEEYRDFKKLENVETDQFVEAVKAGLEAEGSVILPERFDEIADHIEAAAPNLTALYEGIRALGKLYSKSRQSYEGRVQRLAEALGVDVTNEHE